MAVIEREGYIPGIGRARIRIDGALVASLDVIEPILDWQPELATSGLLLPGLVDLQVNGCAGTDFGDPQVGTAEIDQAVRHLWSYGVTAFCPTLITAPLSRMRERLRTLDDARSTSSSAALSLRGAHLEGPWISAEDGARGAHPRAHVQEPEISAALDLVSSGRVAIVTVAPELPGAIGLIGALRSVGVRVSLGHSAASAAEVRPAVEAGATLSTHLGNGVSASLPRHPNLVWEQLAEDRLSAMFIADLHHLDAATLSAMVRAKGERRVILVSDMTSIGGLPPGRHQTWIGGEVELSDSGRLSVVGTPYLAGAALPLVAGLSHVLAHGIMTPAAALASVSDSPRAVIDGTPLAPAALSPGSPADIVLADWDPHQGVVPRETIVGGERVWSRS